VYSREVCHYLNLSKSRGSLFVASSITCSWRPGYNNLISTRIENVESFRGSIAAPRRAASPLPPLGRLGPQPRSHLTSKQQTLRQNIRWLYRTIIGGRPTFYSWHWTTRQLRTCRRVTARLPGRREDGLTEPRQRTMQHFAADCNNSVARCGARGLQNIRQIR
jgi:hypothetical protein